MKVPKGSKWHHLKRGSNYVVVGQIRLQYSTSVPKDGDFLTMYINEDGIYTARHPDEFLDGRFVEIK